MIDLDSGKVIEHKVEKKDKKKEKDQYLVSDGMNVVTKIIINIPEKIEDIMKEINSNKELGSVEFSILCKSKKEVKIQGDSLLVYLEDDFFIPEQEVSSASIEYLEDNVKYDTVIHKHPSGCRAFSATDKEFINSNFMYSLLFVDGSFHTGNCRFPINEDKTIYISLPTTVSVIRPPKIGRASCRERV